MATKKTQTPVQVSMDTHAILLKVTAQQTIEQGRKVTIREVLDKLVREEFIEFSGKSEPEVDQRQMVFEQDEQQAKDPAKEQSQSQQPPLHVQDDGALFAEVMMALISPTPQEQQQAIEGLQGVVLGSFGQRIKLKDLAYHLRSSTAPIATLQELIADYEGGGAKELEEELVRAGSTTNATNATNATEKEKAVL